jgi:hypothetical protein
MNGVRFRFFGQGHKMPLTGHLYLRWADPDNIWRLSSWSKRDGHYETVEGDALKENGVNRFAGAIRDFISGWADLQRQAIDRHVLWSRQYKPNHPLVRPGFRAVKASIHWQRYAKETAEEISSIKGDASMALNALVSRGWTDTLKDEWFEFPTFTFPDPWRT